MLEKKAGYFKIVFTLLLFTITFLAVSGFFDVNLLPRFFAFCGLSILFIAPLKAMKLQFDELLLIGFYLFNLLSCIWADNFSFAIFETQKVFLYFLSYFIGKRVIQVYGVLFISKIIAVIVAIVLLVNSGVFLYNDLSFGGGDTTSAHPNLLSSFLLLCLPFVFIQYHKEERKRKYFSIIVLCFLLLGIIGLGARSVYLGLAVFAVIYTAFELAIKSKKYFKLYIGLLIVGMLFTVTFYLLGNVSIEISSIEERVFVWGKTINVIGDQPFLGAGAGNWIFNYTKYGVSGFGTFEIYGLIMQRPHNDLLWVIAEVGIVGFAIIFSFWFIVVKGLYQAKKSKERSVLLAGVMSFIPVMLLSFPKERIEHIFLFFMLLAAARVYGGSKGKSWHLNGMKSLVMLVSFFSMIVVGIVAKGDCFTNRALLAMKNNQPELVLNNNLRAESVFYTHTNEGIPIASYTAWAYNQLKEKDKMVYYSHLAYNQAPNNYEVATNYGVALNSQKKFNDAEKVLLRANFLNPRYDGAIMNLAIVYYNKGEYKKAKEWIDRIYFKSEVTDYYSGLIHRKLGID